MRAKSLLYGLTYLLGRAMADHGLSILCYHSIDDRRARISVPVAQFALHMQLLHNLGYRTLRLSEIVTYLRAGIPLPRRAVAITFDDGFESVYACAAPLMRAYGFVGTVFIIGGMVGKTIHWRDRDGWLPQLPLMRWQQIRELHALGFEIGAHSLSHQYLTQLAGAQLRAEVEGSKQLIEAQLSRAIDIFCYPFGAYNADVIDAVRQAGYQGACATIPGRLTPSADRFALPRLFVARNTSAAILKAYLNPGVAIGLRVVGAIRSRRASHQPWYVPDPRYTDSTGTVAVPDAIAEEHAL